MSALAIPGDVGIADVSIFRDGYAVVRVVDASALGKLWKIEILERYYDGTLAWSQPKRRKIRRWLPIDAEKAVTVRDTLRAKYEHMRAEEKKLMARYHAEVVDLAGLCRP